MIALAPLCAMPSASANVLEAVKVEPSETLPLKLTLPLGKEFFSAHVWSANWANSMSVKVSLPSGPATTHPAAVEVNVYLDLD